MSTTKTGLRRYLQILDDDEDDVFDKDKDGQISESETRLQVKYSNWCVMNLTTAANYFHALRCQALLRAVKTPP